MLEEEKKDSALLIEQLQERLRRAEADSSQLKKQVFTLQNGHKQSTMAVGLQPQKPKRPSSARSYEDMLRQHKA